MIFLYIVTISGLARAFSDLAQVTNENGTVPRGRWLYVICGLLTIFSGCYGGPPILISPESGAGIKAGGRTGLSSVVGGIIFGLAVFFTPLFQAIPAAATAPLLIAVGVILFANTKKIDWSNYAHAFPAYIILFLIPFTYSILKGVLLGWAAYLIMNFFTGDLFLSTRYIMMIYTPNLAKKLFDDKDIGADVVTDDEPHGSSSGRQLSTGAVSNRTASTHNSNIRETFVASLMNMTKDDYADNDADENPIGMFGDMEAEEKPLKVDFFKALQIAKLGNANLDVPRQESVEIQLQDIEKSPTGRRMKTGNASEDDDSTSNPMM